MNGRACVIRALLVLNLFLLGIALGYGGQLQNEVSPAGPNSSVAPIDHLQPVGNDRPSELELLAMVDGDLVADLRLDSAPDDPCLHRLYKDWFEFAADSKENDPAREFVAFRIVLDRSTFRLNLEGLRRDGASETVYESACGLGEIESPTPEGKFMINHIYAYPDAAFFGTSGEPHRGLYNGFFAPLLACDGDRRCHRFKGLGIHGFNPSAHPYPRGVRLETCGAVSAGCIRVPDPCKFKSILIRLVGIGPLKKNDRGSYHWLDRPVEVVISGEYPDATRYVTLVSLLEDGLAQVQDGLKSLFSFFEP